DFRIPSSDSPSRSRLETGLGTLPNHQTRCDCVWGPTRRDGVRRRAERGYMPRGELTRLAKAHDFAAAPSGAGLGGPLPSPRAPPTMPPPPIRHPPPVAGVGSPTCFAVTARPQRPCDPTDPPQCRPTLAGKGCSLSMAASPLATVVSGYVNEICITAGGPVK